MQQSTTRRHFIARSTAACAVAPMALLSGRAAAQNAPPKPDVNPAATDADVIEEMVRKQRAQKGPPLADLLVRDLVFWAHSDLEKVKSIIGRQPRLINCAFDWGGGDYET